MNPSILNVVELPTKRKTKGPNLTNHDLLVVDLGEVGNVEVQQKHMFHHKLN